MVNCKRHIICSQQISQIFLRAICFRCSHLVAVIAAVAEFAFDGVEQSGRFSNEQQKNNNNTDHFENQVEIQ